MSFSRGRTILTAALAALAVAVVGGLMTDLGPWYQGLEKPSWQPPGIWFGPVWTMLYALTAMAAALAWWSSDSYQSRMNVLIWFLFNAVLNVTWSLLFFRFQRPDWALSEWFLFWFSIVIMIWICWKRNRTAAMLLIPYLAWVTFAGILNAEIVKLNGPFG
ncbi:MAG TPA: TspO/MBR family protein [Xanthomonadales bacterium]|nr:TspO/MBR family protein [Xanthomonadales bacterium]